MKAGFEDRRKVYMAIALGVVMVFLLWRWVSSSESPAPGEASSATPMQGAAHAPAIRPRGSKGKDAGENLDPSLRTPALKSVESEEYQGSGRNIFEYAQARPVQPRPTVPGCAPHCPPPAPTPRPTPPPPPPIPLKFYGFASRPGEPARIFLAEGEDIFIAGEGDIVNRHYKVMHIGKTSVEIEDVMNNNRQTIPLTQS